MIQNIVPAIFKWNVINVNTIPAININWIIMIEKNIRLWTIDILNNVLATAKTVRTTNSEYNSMIATEYAPKLTINDIW